MSGSEYFVSTAQRGRAHRVGQWCVLCNQYWDAVENHSESHASEWSLWSVHQQIWMFAGNEFADGLAAKGAEAHQHSEWTIKKIAGVRSLVRAVQRRVATVTVDMSEHYGATLHPALRGGEAPGCGVHVFTGSSFTAVRVSLFFFLALTVLCAQSWTHVFGTLASEVKNLKKTSRDSPPSASTSRWTRQR